MGRITSKSQIKPGSDYTIWFRRKSWPRTGPGSYVIERSYNGHTILYDWDEMKIGGGVGFNRYQGSDGWFVYPRGEDPTQPKARKKATKRKATKRRPTTQRTQKMIGVFDEELGGTVQVTPLSERYVLHPKYTRDGEIEKFIVKSCFARELRHSNWPSFGTRWAAEAQARRDLADAKEMNRGEW